MPLHNSATSLDLKNFYLSLSIDAGDNVKYVLPNIKLETADDVPQLEIAEERCPKINKYTPTRSAIDNG